MFYRAFQVHFCLFCSVLFLSVYCKGGKGICLTMNPEYSDYNSPLYSGYDYGQEYCCDGYMRDFDADGLACKAVCEPECIHGFCASPGSCKCDSGYIPDIFISSICQPFCSEGCAHGTCTAPDTCTCHHGYTLINGQCEPLCSKNCTHGTCTEPEKCICHHGYTLIAGNCEPFCYRACTNGTCVAPGICTCDRGYTLIDDQCEPVCSERCTHGSCVAPETCGCDEGWEMVDSACRPICTEPCNNATCVAPNSCQCDPGYSNYNSTVCKLIEDEPSTTIDATTVEWLMQSTEYNNEAISEYYSYVPFITTDIPTNYTNAARIDNVPVQNRTWIVPSIIAVVIVLLIILAVVKRNSLLGFIKGRSYNVEGEENKELDRDADLCNVQF